jgi:hypothetical protein
MGYTTSFEGEFHCYRPESEQLRSFLEAIRAGDRDAIAPLADWLTDQGDARGPQLCDLLPQMDNDLTALWRLFALRREHANYLWVFSRTRRMRRDPGKALLLADPVREMVGLPLGEDAGYFTGVTVGAGQGDESILDYNRPPKGQPGLWCQWIPNGDDTAIVWDGGEKFYNYVAWLEYLLDHFLRPWGYLLNGAVSWRGEQESDRGIIHVRENTITVEREG